jgi:hypothetical protein
VARCGGFGARQGGGFQHVSGLLGVGQEVDGIVGRRGFHCVIQDMLISQRHHVGD